MEELKLDLADLQHLLTLATRETTKAIFQREILIINNKIEELVT